MAEINQLLDVTSDPQAKQMLLSGQINLAQCPACGYQGMIPTPIVYHDAEKELLLTFFPPEIGLPVNEQEKLIGPLINQVMNRLPQEKRKAYLLRPQTMLSMQHLIERVLEGDGITKEMIQDQQKKVDLIRRLMEAAPESRVQIVENEKDLIDDTFFGLFSRLMESAVMGRDEKAAKELADIQQIILEKTDLGQEILKQNAEAEAAVKALQEAGKSGLTREKLVDLFVESTSEIRTATLVRLARNGMDYAFFQILTGKIDQASGDEKDRLSKLRDDLLKMTAEIDLELQEQASRIKGLIDKLVESPDIEKTTQQILPAVNEIFVDVLRQEIQSAREKSDIERAGKLQKIVEVIQKASAPPPEYELLEKLLSANGEEDIQKELDTNAEKITPEFIQLLSGVISQAETQGEEEEIKEKLKIIHRLALKLSMRRSMAQ
jgi:hypothetical protein